MNILLNFFPLQSGGGQQVAMNFLQTVSTLSFNHNWFVYVGESSELHSLAKTLLPSSHILSTRYSYFARFLNYKIVLQFAKSNQISLIYNYAPVLPVKGIPQVVRTVYSNLYFPEIDFWNSYPWYSRIKKRFIDKLRLHGTLKADGLVFENESMQKRVHELFLYSIENTIYIEPSVTSFDETKINPRYTYINKINCFKILYLSSWYLNKNIIKLPEVAAYLRKDGICVQFLLSIDQDNKDVIKFLIKKIKRYKVLDYFIFLGKIESIYVHQVVKSSDAMILLSKLECFSSNIIEAFYFNKPLIISNEPWAKAACADAALYVNRDDAEDIKDAIKILLENPLYYYKIVENGKLRLKAYNTPFQKVRKQVEFLESVYAKAHLY